MLSWARITPWQERSGFDPAPKEQPPRKLSGKRTVRAKHSGKQAGRAASGTPHRRGKPGLPDEGCARSIFQVFGQRGRSTGRGRRPAMTRSNPETKDARPPRHRNRALTRHASPGLEIRAKLKPGHDRILTPGAMAFVASLERKFGAERKRLLAQRAAVQAKLDAGWRPDFPAETRAIRESDWTVAPLPEDLARPPRRNYRPDRPQDGDQRAEFRRQRVHGGFRGCEHAELGQSDRGPDQPRRRRSPHHRLRRSRDQPALRVAIAKTATLLVRPRGWHLPEAHVLVDGAADVGLVVRFRAVSSSTTPRS